MFLEFTVENFRSIKEKASLSLVPSASDAAHPDNVFTKGSAHALRSVSIYGANASGKSNLLQAVTAALVTLRSSNARQITDKMGLIVPFKFDDLYLTKPSIFEFTFVADDGLKYIYGFSADQERIYEEYLYCYHSAKPSRIFERKEGDVFEFNASEQKALGPIVERNTSNKLFLATATAWNYDKTTAAYKWLAQQIDTYGDPSAHFGRALDKYTEDASGALQQFTLHLLHQADINIDDYSVDVQTIAEPAGNPFTITLTPNVPVKIQGGTQKIVNIRTGHVIKDDEQNPHRFQLEFNEESLGTQQLFMLSPILKEVFDHGKVMLIDELDKSLHSFLVQHIVDLFQNPDVNRNGAQLIFTTHDTNLLSLDTFRRDQVYFVEKNPKDAASTVYSLDEFSVRKSENIERGYLLGRYGAVPFLHPEVDIWQ